jgi:quercetin dioxygenase-like cupin family protein
MGGDEPKEEIAIPMTSRTHSDFVFVESHDTVAKTPESGLVRRVGAYNDRLFLAEHLMSKDWVGVRHSHPHEQMVYIVSGHLRVTIGETTFNARAGDSFVVRGGVEHQVSALAESMVIDVFTPCRTDYL